MASSSSASPFPPTSILLISFNKNKNKKRERKMIQLKVSFKLETAEEKSFLIGEEKISASWGDFDFALSILSWVSFCHFGISHLIWSARSIYVSKAFNCCVYVCGCCGFVDWTYPFEIRISWTRTWLKYLLTKVGSMRIIDVRCNWNSCDQACNAPNLLCKKSCDFIYQSVVLLVPF